MQTDDRLTVRNEDGRVWIRQVSNKKDAENVVFSVQFGERDRIRTCDPVIKSHLLYQLSYAPVIP